MLAQVVSWMGSWACRVGMRCRWSRRSREAAVVAYVAADVEMERGCRRDEERCIGGETMAATREMEGGGLDKMQNGESVVAEGGQRIKWSAGV